MRNALFCLLLLGLTGCPTPRGDDDDSGYVPADDDDATGDDDDATGDDDDATGDDDDDDATGDDATGDDDDDDATGDDDDATGDDDDATGDDDDTGTAADFSQSGPQQVTSSDSSLSAGTSCALEYTLFEPVGASNAPLVVLAHGFQRGRAQMAVLGEHLASWGLRVATPQLCHSSILDTNHELNGDDMVALADALAAGADVAYAGYSAGGLSAVVAASGDPDTAALVGLDLVDSGSIGSTYAPSVTAVAHNVVGTSNQCNSSNNGVGLVAGLPAALQARVTDAVRPGVLYSPKGTWLNSSATGQTVNALIPADMRTDIEEGACYNETFVELTPA